MAITGTHMLFYSRDAERLRATLRDMFGFKHVDAGEGWLIFQLPPAELGVHPAEGNPGEHSVSFMCDDINKTIAELRAKGVTVSGDPQDHGYGIVTHLQLPGGVQVQLYEPRHPIAAAIASKSPSRPAKKKAPTKNTVKKTSKKKANPRPFRRVKKAARRR